MNDTESLEGSVERITFYNPENGYTVLRLRPRRGDVVTVVGNLPEVQPGESLRLGGQWSQHPQHGAQFKAISCQQILPATIEGIRKYLGSGLIKGVGPRTAERIVKAFGSDTLRVLEETPERLRDVPSIGAKRAEDIAQAWQAQQAIKGVMLFLQSHGVSTGLAVKLYKQYGDGTIEIVRTDPYRLAREVHGIGFLTADQIAQHLGLPHDAPSRIEAGVLYTLSRLGEEGHIYAPHDALITRGTELLGVAPEPITAALTRLIAAQELFCETLPAPAPAASSDMPAPDSPPDAAPTTHQAVYLRPFYFAELGAAHSIRTLIHTPQSSLLHDFHALDWPNLFIQIARLPGMVPLSAQQQGALRTALTHKVTILTGGPGTGKSTSMRALIAALEQFHHTYALASPTGRAAKRLAEATGRQAQTIHRLLGFSPVEGFQRNAENPLAVDMVIIDEVSMLDLLLANHLFKALSPQTHLLLVGDVDQLPSVGPGNVLRDLITSAEVPVVRLETIFRQAAQSLIIVNSHRIRQGEPLHIPPETHDFFLFVKDDPLGAAELIVDLVTQRMPAKFGLDARQDIQVLSPMYRGDAGVTELNRRLQGVLNPPTPDKPERALAGGRILRVGDRVLQTRNDYEREVFNGDLGRITHIDLENQRMLVDIDGRAVQYDWASLDELVHAYAISIHRAQGSEYPAVVIPVLTQHFKFLQRNLLYTAVTRAKKLAILVGSRKAIAIALKNNEIAQRWSALSWRVQHARATPLTPDDLWRLSAP